MILPRITYDARGTPAVWAENVTSAYYGIGFVHGLHRPLQTLLIAAAGRGELAARLAPRGDLVRLDAVARRLDVPARAAVEARRLSARAAAWLDAFVSGCRAGVAHGGLPFELRLLAASLAPPTRESVVGGLLLAAYLGLAEGQERMERALVDAVQAGAEPALLDAMFRPHLDGWDAARLRPVRRHAGPGFAAHGLVPAAGGSNAWAIAPERSAGGTALLAGDPHLQVSQLPSLLFELRLRVGGDFWLGATIPGLPGVAVGRNRRVAWCGTFAVADNVDFTVEHLEPRGARRPGGEYAAVVEREVEIRRRWRSPLWIRFFATDRGVIETADAPAGERLASRWAGADRAAETLEAHMALPLARSAAEAEETLLSAHAFSLHFVLADSGGDVRYCQTGRVPRRSGGWSGLCPARGEESRRWLGFYEGRGLPREGARAGMVASANEARPAPDGGTLATLAQPDYRRDRIESWLAARTGHDLASFCALQLDVRSLQADRLRGPLLAGLDAGPVRAALAAWDGRCDVASRGAHAFELAYGAALRGLAPELGGDWLLAMLEESELRVWWCAAFDRVLGATESWSGARGDNLRRALRAVSATTPAAWGEVHRLRMPHLLLGGLGVGGLDRGPFALPGSIATVRQGTTITLNGQETVTAPAYRFVCDLGEEGALTSVPGGIDGSRFSGSYDCWLGDWLAGEYHRLDPPREDEAPLDR